MQLNKGGRVVNLVSWKGNKERCTKMRYLAKQRAEEFRNRFAEDPLEVLICCLDAQEEGMLGNREAVEQIFYERLKRETRIRREVLKVAKETHLNSTVVYGIFITELNLS